MPERDDADLKPLEDLLTRSRGLEHAPERLVQKALDSFDVARQTAPARDAPPSPLQRLLAVLSFDEIGAGLSPVRASGPAVRRLVFSSGDLDVALSVSEGSRRGTWRIEGQCLGDDGPGQAQLTCGDLQLEAPWSPQAEFGFDAVPSGECRLLLRTARWELTLPPFELTSAG